MIVSWGNYHYNRLLQGLSNSSDIEKMNSILQSSKIQLNSELKENVSFNRDLLDSNVNGSGLDFRVFNLESNSAQSDFSPAFYRNSLLFTSGRPADKRGEYGPSGEAYLDIFAGKLEENGGVTGVIRFMDIQNSDYHKATPYFSRRVEQCFLCAFQYVRR